MEQKTVRRLVGGAAAVVIAIGAGACGSSDSADGGGGTSTGSGKGGMKIALVTPAARNDGGLTQYSLEGVDAALEQIGDGELTSVVDNVTEPQKQIQTLRTLAQSNDVVIADSATLNQAVDAVAPSFPDTKFIMVAGPTKQFHENVTSVVPQPGYAAAVVGRVAAERTRTGKLGMVAGTQVPASEAWAFGMRQGAAEAGRPATVAATYTGDYNDVGKAKQAAEAMIANGVDQIIADLDSGSEGVFQAAEAAKGKGVEVYQVFGLNCEASDAVVGSGVINWASVIKDALTSQAEGSLKPGVTFYTLKSRGAVNYEWCPGKSAPAQEKAAKEIAEQFVSGALKPAKGVVDADPGYDVVQK